MKILYTTDSSNISAFIIRLTLAIVFFAHGAQKALGWFGGNGLSGTLSSFTEGAGLPWIIALLIVIFEFLGSIALFIGFVTRIAALGISCVMIGAISTVHIQYGFFMNWSNNQGGEGFEFHILALGMLIALMVAGGGKWSVDSLIYKRKYSGSKGRTF